MAPPSTPALRVALTLRWVARPEVVIFSEYPASSAFLEVVFLNLSRLVDRLRLLRTLGIQIR